jgi:hypothetical protein
LFKDTPNKKKLDLENIKVSNDVVIYFYDKISSDDLSKEVKERLVKLINVIKDKGYNLRIFCVNANPILKLIDGKLDVKRVNLIKPWKSYCNLDKYRTWMPSDINIELAAEYASNFDKSPTAIKSIKSALVTLLTSYTGRDLARAVFIHDPYYKPGDKIDFTKSKDTFDLIKIAEAMDVISVYNINNEDEFEDGIKVLEKK